MRSKNRDPRILLLLVATLPFVSWISGAIVIGLCRQQWWSLGIGVAVIMFGFQVAGSLLRINNFIFKVCFRPTLANYEFTEWVAVELEKTGTQDKAHVLPDTVALVVRLKDETYDLIKLDGEAFFLDVDNWNFSNVSKLKSTCSILVTDSDGNDVIGYVITPIYKGSTLKIVCEGKLRFQWFLQWLGVEPVVHTNS